jgi:hypothetical protein
MSRQANQTVPSRQCGSCTLCCKLLGIAALEKPRNSWCRHCAPGKGCGIYETRPEECRAFFCGWITSADLGEEWRPDRAKLLLAREAGGRIVVHCDAAAPGAWRRAPYYARIKAWATKRADGSRQEVVVLTGNRITFLAPEGEFDLGQRGPGEQMLTRYAENGSLVEVRLVAKPVSAEASAGGSP